MFHQERLPTAAFLAASTSDRDRMEMRVKGESGFVLKQIAKLKDMDATEQQRMALRLCFLSALLKVHRLQGQIRRTAKKRFHQFAESHDMDLPLLEFLLPIFFEERSELLYPIAVGRFDASCRRSQGQMVRYQIPESRLRLLLCYILIVALMIVDSEMDHEMVTTLRTELKTSSKSLMQSFQSFGAKVMKRAQHTGFAIRYLKDGKQMKEVLPRITQSNVPGRFQS